MTVTLGTSEGILDGNSDGCGLLKLGTKDECNTSEIIDGASDGFQLGDRDRKRRVGPCDGFALGI